jgi:hypothetical protein
MYKVFCVSVVLFCFVSFASCVLQFTNVHNNCVMCLLSAHVPYVGIRFLVSIMVSSLVRVVKDSLKELFRTARIMSVFVDPRVP